MVDILTITLQIPLWQICILILCLAVLCIFHRFKLGLIVALGFSFYWAYICNKNLLSLHLDPFTLGYIGLGIIGIMSVTISLFLSE